MRTGKKTGTCTIANSLPREGENEEQQGRVMTMEKAAVVLLPIVKFDLSLLHLRLVTLSSPLVLPNAISACQSSFIVLAGVQYNYA